MAQNDMKKYKVTFSGFHYVMATSPEEALEKAKFGDEAYSATDYGTPEEVAEFLVEV